MNQPWTSRPSIIDALLSLFQMLTKAVDPTREKTEEPNVRLPRLAEVLFESVKERLDWLQRLVICLPSTLSSGSYLYLASLNNQLPWKLCNNGLQFSVLRF